MIQLDHLYQLIRYEKENNGPSTTNLDSFPRTRYCLGDLLPFKALIRSKSSEKGRARQAVMPPAQRALIQRGPGTQLFDFTVVIRQFRRLLSGIFKQRIQTNLSNARLFVLASANVGRSS